MADFYELKTPATEQPVTLAEARLWVRRGVVTTDDDLISALIKAATAQGEAYCNRVFVQRTFTGYFDAILSSSAERYPFIQLRRAPLVSLTSVKVTFDGSPVTLVVDTDYQLKNKSTFARVLFPETPPVDDVAYPLQAEFIAGYGAATDVPEDIKTAIKEHVAFLYENRGDALPDKGVQIPPQVREKYSKYRILNTY